MKPGYRHALLWVGIAGLGWVTLWGAIRMTASSSDSATDLLQTSARDARRTVEGRIRSARLMVDSIHEVNSAAISGRRQSRLRDSHRGAEGATGEQIVPDAESAYLDCARVLRADDRLVRNLSAEIDDTREMLDDYEELRSAYDHEVQTCTAVLTDCRRDIRRKRRRNRTFVAAAAIVSLVVLLDR